MIDPQVEKLTRILTENPEVGEGLARRYNAGGRHYMPKKASARILATHFLKDMPDSFFSEALVRVAVVMSWAWGIAYPSLERPKNYRAGIWDGDWQGKAEQVVGSIYEEKYEVALRALWLTLLEKCCENCEDDDCEVIRGYADADGVARARCVGIDALTGQHIYDPCEVCHGTGKKMKEAGKVLEALVG